MTMRRTIRFGLLMLVVMQSRAVADGPKPLIPNGDFETSADKQWPDGWQRPKGVRWLEEAGNHFLRLSADEPGAMVLLYRRVDLPADVKALRLEWRQRIANLVPGKQPWFDARIMLEFKDAAGANAKPGPAAPYSRGNTDGWTRRNVEFLVPEGAKSLELMPTLFQVQSGTFDLDDVSLVAIDPEPLRKAAAAQAAEKEAKQSKAAGEHRTKAAALLKATGSLVPNGDFESAKKPGWPDHWGHPKGATWEVNGDNHYLRLTSTKPGEMISLYQPIDLPAEVQALELSWKQRVTGLKTGKLPWFDARIMLEFRDAGNQVLSHKPSPPYAQHDTKGWVTRSTKFLVPAEALTLVLMPALFQVERGTFDIDDVKLVPIDAAPLIAQAKANAETEKRLVVPPEAEDRTKWPSELHVDGRRVLDKAGNSVWLQGVNAGGLETLPDDRHVIKSALVGVAEWKANIIRLPVKDDFWFGRTPTQNDGGKAYRDYLDRIVTIAANRGAYVLLDLHRFRAPRPEHVEFWKSAGAHYKDHPAVLFDLFNEPHGISWEVWRDGGFVSERETKADEDAFLTEAEKAKAKQGFQSPGMQKLLDAVRDSGAKNIVVAGGLAWSADLSGIARGIVLTDKTGNGIIYGWHIYNWHTDWAGKVLGAAEKYPILVGEMGADAKKLDFIPAAAQEDPYTWVPDMLGFVQKHRLHWTGWCLHPAASPVMISDWDYTPTPFWGAFAKRALAGERFEMKKMR
jgi:endoglucanase